MVVTVSVGHDPAYPWDQQEDYYLGGSEPRGTYYAPTGMFGLADGALIDRTVYFRMMDGQDPRTGDELCKANAQGKRVPYYDITFEAPKSVSLLWALTDDQTRARLEALHMRAVERAMDYVRQEATFTRLGRDGAQVVKTDLLAFKFQHGEARPVSDAKAAGLLNEDAAKAAGVDRDALDRVNSACSDMHLHVHVAVPNMAFTLDDAGHEHWTALDGRGFFYAQKGAGAVYHAELAALLQSELGANIRFARDTTFEVEGLPQEALTHFSKRARQIQEILAEFGVAKGDSVKLAEAAQVLSRLGKEGEGSADRFARWRAEAAQIGLTPDIVQAVLNRAPERPRDATDIERFGEPITEWDVARATYGQVVTETESVVSRHDLTIAAARLAIEHGRGAADVHAVVTEALDRGEVIAIGEDETIPGQAVFTTTEMQLIEQRLAEVWRPDPADRRHVIAAETVEAYLMARAAEGRALTDEQRRGVLWVTSRPGLGTALEGAAGTGKSYSNGAVVDLYRAQGYACYGASSEWLAAKVLAEEAGLAEGSSKAVAKWLADWEQGKNLPAERSLWILDEAGKSGARDLLAFTEYLKAAGARLILSGDLRQQLGVSAGPGLRIAVEQAGSFRLEKTRRMEVQVDDVLVHRDGLSRKDAIGQAQAMTPDDRAALVRDHGAAAEAQADAWAANPLATIRAADVLVHVRGLLRADAEAQAARMDPADRKALVREHHESVARQGAIWARQAATDMSMGRAAEALEAFAVHGQLLWFDRAEDAVRAAVANWMAFRTERPGATALVIAKRNDDVAALTAEMRAWLKERGQLGAVDTEIRAVSRRGAHQLMLTTGDQIRFTRRDDKLGVVNGHLGVVLDVVPLAGKPGHATLTVHLPDDGRTITFDTTAIADRKGRARLEHFFASTTYSVQGATKTALFGILDTAETSNGAYVAASRAKEMTRFYVSRQNIDARLRERLPPEERLNTSLAFTDEERRAFLAKALSRAQEKTCTLDYAGDDAPAPLAPAALWRDHDHPPASPPSAPTAERVRRAGRAAANTRPRSTPVSAIPARTAAQRVQQHGERTPAGGRRAAPAASPRPAARPPVPSQPASQPVAQARARRDAAERHARGALLAAKTGNAVLAENARAAAAAEHAQFVAEAVQIVTSPAMRREADVIGLGVAVREAAQERRAAERQAESDLAADVCRARDLAAAARSERLMATVAKLERRDADEASHLAAAARMEQDLHTVAVQIVADPAMLAQADTADIGRAVRHAARQPAAAPAGKGALPDLPRAGSLVTVTDMRTGKRYDAVLVGLHGRNAVKVQRLDDGAVKCPTLARNTITAAREPAYTPVMHRVEGTPREQKAILLAARKAAAGELGPDAAELRREGKTWTLRLIAPTASSDAAMADAIARQVEVRQARVERARARGGLPAPANPSLCEWLSRRGGVTDAGGDLRTMGAADWHRSRPGYGRLIRNPDNARDRRTAAPGEYRHSHAPDELLERAKECGFFRADADLAAFYRAIDAELRGRPHYASGLAPVADSVNAGRDRFAMEQEADELGIDPTGLSDDDLRWLLTEAQRTAEAVEVFTDRMRPEQTAAQWQYSQSDPLNALEGMSDEQPYGQPAFSPSHGGRGDAGPGDSRPVVDFEGPNVCIERPGPGPARTGSVSQHRGNGPNPSSTLKAYARTGTDPHRLAALLQEADAHDQARGAAALDRLEQSEHARIAERLAAAGENMTPSVASEATPAESAAAPNPAWTSTGVISLQAREDRAFDLHQRARTPDALRHPLEIFTDACTQYDDNEAAQRVEILTGDTDAARRSGEAMQVLYDLVHAAATQVLCVPAAREAALAAGLLPAIQQAAQTPSLPQLIPPHHEPDLEMGE